MILSNLIAAASFSPNLLPAPSAWLGHLPFSCWVIREVSPKIFVELGTHYGHSYFSFCQAVSEASITTKCYAVDTWQGDEHAGQYGDEIFIQVNTYHQVHYAEFSRLLRMTFDDATEYFADGSIDLLHIDGHHTYEAVKHDFETWLPKLAPGAVVLFHDTNVRERGFGVWQLWEELQAQYPLSLEFLHSHGLGVLQLANGAAEKQLSWLQHGTNDQQVLKNYFAALGTRQADRYEMEDIRKAVAERDRQIAGLHQVVSDRDGQIAGLNQAVAEREEEIMGLYSSRSWRTTAPLRWGVHQLKMCGNLTKILCHTITSVGGLRAITTKACRVYRTEGLAGIKRRFNSSKCDGFERNNYAEWIRRYDTLDADSRQYIREKITSFPRMPKISVLMPVYDPPLRFLDDAIWSVRNQLYSNWELCIADDASKNPEVRDLLKKHADEDARIKVVYREVNGHISATSNSAFDIATGEFVALLDNDDLLAEHALFWVVKTILNNPEADLIYSDEDKVDEEGRRVLPFFKPGWSPHLAISQAYLGHLVCISASVLKSVGGWRSEKDGAQDYDLWLRVSLQARQVVHIPYVLYHWRMHQNSTALNTESKPYAHMAGLLSVRDYLKARYPFNNIDASDGEYLFTYKAKFNLNPKMLVSIIIPTKDRLDLLSSCIDTIINISSWKNFEILIIDNGSEETETLDYLENIHDRDSRIRVVSANIPFNWSHLNNIGARHCTGEMFIFLNNDIEVLSDDWIQSLTGYANLPDVAIAGGLLLFEDGSIQHCGVVVGMGGWADHVFRLQSPAHSCGGPFVSPALTRNVLAVTGACMAISRDKYNQLGGFDEEFTICGSDVELGLRAHTKGFYNVMCAEAKLIHFESKTRTPHVPAEDFVQSDKKYAPYRVDQVDPFFNPNLSLKSTLPTIEMEPGHDTTAY